MAASPQSPNNIGDNRYLAGTNIENGIVATPGGTQAAAYQLQAQLSRIDTVGTAADSVALPKIQGFPNGDARPGAVGQLVFIRNNTAAAAQVFGATPDTINAVATATGISLPAGKGMIAWASSFNQTTNVGTWEAVLSV